MDWPFLWIFPLGTDMIKRIEQDNEGDFDEGKQ